MNTDTSVRLRFGAINRPTTINVSGFTTRDYSPKVVQGLEAVVLAICRAFGIERQFLLSSSRREDVAWPRQLGMALAYERDGYSLHSVGEYFGRDYSTVLHAVQRVKARCETDGKCREQLERVKGMIQ